SMRVSGRSGPSIPAVKIKQVCLQIPQFSQDVAAVTPDTGGAARWSPGQYAASPIWAAAAPAGGPRGESAPPPMGAAAPPPPGGAAGAEPGRPGRGAGDQSAGE